MTTRKLAVLAAALVAVAVPAAASASHTEALPQAAVFTLTNSASGNGVATFARNNDGTLTYAGTVASGGLGTGANLGSQGAIALTPDGHTLFAVNAGSDSISEFAVTSTSVDLVTTFASNGVRPISLTVQGNLLYVLNAGGSGSITGFVIGGATVAPLAGSTQPLLGSNPAQIAFSPHGSQLVVSEKGTKTLDTYAVDSTGRAEPPVSSPSAGATPFGFAFDQRGRAFVSEAAGSASSYTVDDAGARVISGAVATNQGAPCWLVVTKNGRYAYTANAASSTISGFAIAPNGSLALLDPSGATAALAAGSHPLDEAVSGNGRFLYVLVDGRHTIAGYRIAEDGSLSLLGELGALPAGAVGLASS
jgi:6-phosphogluconolactonase (cycloisomerase 2 family)